MQEFGGCLPLELLPTLNDPFAGISKWEFNSGRSCIYAALNSRKAEKIYLPFYLCPTVKSFLSERGVEIEEYHLDQQFLPKGITLGSNEMLLWVNYYGCMKESIIDQLTTQFDERLIIDNTQAFFCKPRLNAWNIYACRKFIGVPEGAYLVHEGLVQEHWGNYPVAWEYLQKASNSSSNEAYKDYQKAENQFAFGLQNMSLLTRQYLNAIDYAEIQNRRLENFLVLHAVLRKYNEYTDKIDFTSKTAYMYPFLNCKNEIIRKELLTKKIYTPTWWKHMLDQPEITIAEKYLVKNLIPIPIDQRYTPYIMECVGNLIIERINAANAR